MMNDNAPTTGREPETHPEAAAFPVVLFGKDDKGKAHAAIFAAEDAALAEKAAALMGMRVLRIPTEEEAALAVGCAKGRIFEASGRGFVPFCNAAVFAKLDAAPNAFSPTPPADAEMPRAAAVKPMRKHLGKKAADVGGAPADAASSPVSAPADWKQVGVGSIVLAAEEGTAPTVWYVAAIVAQRGEDVFQLRWGGADWVDEPHFWRRREHLSLLSASVAATITV